MRKIKEPISIFIVVLFLILHVVGVFHVWLLERNIGDIYKEAIAFPYFINFILATFITSFLYAYRKKFVNSLGFLFMAGSLLKFAVFFLLFKPMYAADGDISHMEFGYFFVPYAICLAAETIFLIRVLNSSDPKEFG